MINSIELKNWKTHKSTKLSFTKGTNVLIGLMGAGKSSVMDAISYGLFGVYPAIQHRRVNVADIITNRPVQESEAMIRLNFELDGDSYDIERSITTIGPAKATLQKNGSYLQSQPQRVNEEIEKILKVDYDLFSRAIYSEQNRLDYFLELRASERKQQMDELLGLDKFALAQENVTSLINRIKDFVSDQEKMAENLEVEELKKNHKLLKGELKSLEEKKEQLDVERRKVEGEVEKAEAELKKVKNDYASKIKLAKELAELKSKVEFVNGEIEKLGREKLQSKAETDKEISKTKEQIDELGKEEQKSKEKERKLAKELADAEAQVKQIKQRIAEREKIEQEHKGRDIEKEEAEMKKASEHLHELEKRLAQYESEKGEGAKWIAELQKHISKCPVCERELDEGMKKRLIEGKNSIVASSDARIREASKQISEKRVEIEKRTKDLDRLRLSHEKLKDYSGLEPKLKEFESAAVAATSSYEKEHDSSEKLRKSLDKSTNALNDLQSDREKSVRLEDYKKKLLGLEEEHKGREKEHNSIKVGEEEVEKKQREVMQVASSLVKIKSEIDAHSKYISEKGKQVKEKEEQIRKVEKIFEDLKKKKSTVENLTKFKNALEETQITMRSRLISSINNVMQNIWPDLYPYEDYSSIMLDAKSNDYSLMVKTGNAAGGKWEAVEAIASGGERSIACLAMRVAFSLVLVPNLKWIILDEPTHNIDEQGMNRFIKVFNETLPRIIDQIFIITHDEALKQAASAKTYLLTRDKAANGATIVQEQ